MFSCKRSYLLGLIQHEVGPALLPLQSTGELLDYVVIHLVDPKVVLERWRVHYEDNMEHVQYFFGAKGCHVFVLLVFVCLIVRFVLIGRKV